MPISVKLQTTRSMGGVLEMKPEYLAWNQLCLKPACGLLNMCEPKYSPFFFFLKLLIAIYLHIIFINSYYIATVHPLHCMDPCTAQTVFKKELIVFKKKELIAQL